ncbi:MAG: aspartate aminotransferase family protein [Bacteroidales bacterium]|nr:aspartate aminotransferase family protein [Bacteroidales bacterium]
MLNTEEFRKYGHEFIDWMANYYASVEQYPVKSKVKPKDIYNKLPDSPPEEGESMEAIFEDFKKIILPGITHWQSPNWFGYFPANTSYPSILAEMLTATLSAQCMIWDTSPAATELEEKVMNWLKQMMGLPGNWDGVIQDTASTATLCSILTARERASQYRINKTGLQKSPAYRIYASEETHSSIDKAVRIAGLGIDNLVKVGVDNNNAIIPDLLQKAIEADIRKGMTPLCIIGTIGTTGTLAIDPILELGKIAEKYNCWFHVDAAHAGSAMILPEYRWMINGIEYADSYVFNPHKWLFTNFDLSAYFVKDKDALIRTFSILPEYLKTKSGDQVKNYRDWGIQLGRRFRALKLWFVIRNFGLEGLRNTLRNQINWIQKVAKAMEHHPEFEIMAPVQLNMICFRYHPAGIEDEEQLNGLNESLLDLLNRNGKMFLTHTKIKGKYTIRFVAGQTYLEERHVAEAWEYIQKMAKEIS